MRHVLGCHRLERKRERVVVVRSTYSSYESCSSVEVGLRRMAARRHAVSKIILSFMIVKV